MPSSFKTPLLIFTTLIFTLSVMQVFAADEVIRAPQAPVIGTTVDGDFGLSEFDWNIVPDEPYTITGDEPYVDPNDEFYGRMWSPNVGWLDFNQFDVARVKIENIADEWQIQGKAWGENFGWLDFHPTDISGDSAILDRDAGVFSGKAWSDNVGWLDMTGIQVDIVPTSPIDITFATADTFAADDNKSITINYPTIGGAAVKRVLIRAEKFNKEYAADDPTTYDEYATLTFSHNFQDVDGVEVDGDGKRAYTIYAEIEDEAGNISRRDLVATVVANWYSAGTSPMSLKKFREGVETPAEIPVADGSDYYLYDLQLKDQYGNGISGVAGIKEAKLYFTFENTNDLNQMENSDVGDAAVFHAPNFLVINETLNTGGPAFEKQIVLDSDLCAGCAAGNFNDLQVKAYAPTDDVYADTTSPNTIVLTKVELQVTTVAAHTGVGEGIIDTLAGGFGATSFRPALANAIENFPAASIQIGAPENYTLKIDNLSKTNSIQNIQVIQRCSFSDPSQPVACFIQDIEDTRDLTSPPYELWEVDPYALYATLPLYTELSSPVDAEYQVADYSNVVVTDTDSRNQSIYTDGAVNAGVKMSLLTEMGYVVSGKRVAHLAAKTGEIDVKGGEIEIRGRVRSDVVGPLSGEVVNSLGDVRLEEMKDAIEQEVALIVRNSNIEAGGTITLNSWDAPGYELYDGNVIYFKNDIILDNVVIPEGAHTLIVEGGNVRIKTNLTYAGDDSSLGIIALKGESDTAGNIFIHPSVETVVGIWYVEGSILSWDEVSADGTYDYGDINTRTALANQLHIKGTVISNNTLGGSSKIPPELPFGMLYPEGTTNKRNHARKFDFKYTRYYIPGGGGAASSTTTSDAAVVLEFDADLLTTDKIPHGFRRGIGVETAETAG